VFGGALAQIAIGLVLGIPSVLLAGRILSDQLYQVRSSDTTELVREILSDFP